MKYYVLNHNFNEDVIELFDIFNSSSFYDGVDKLLKNFITFDDFKEKLEKLAMYCFWSKAEYEIICKGLISKDDKEQKIDVYDQIKPNIDILARYIIDCYNNRRYARKKINVEEETAKED